MQIYKICPKQIIITIYYNIKSLKITATFYLKELNYNKSHKLESVCKISRNSKH